MQLNLKINFIHFDYLLKLLLDKLYSLTSMLFIIFVFGKLTTKKKPFECNENSIRRWVTGWNSVEWNR